MWKKSISVFVDQPPYYWNENFFMLTMNFFMGSENYWTVTLVNETQDLRETERNLGEPSFTELGTNSMFIEVMVMALLIIYCFVSLQIL